jgi:ABC-type phosphate/phosphonate transport system substrate-binding protein
MIASLMMYERPELADAHDRLWVLIRANLADVGVATPENLSQDAEEFAVWKHPELVLSQTCGMPYRLWLHDKVQLVGTPDYGLEGCPAGHYRSALVVRANDPRVGLADYRDAIFAYNQAFSQSGYAAPYQHMKSKGFWFGNRLHTNAHLQSAKAVAKGRADIASLDAVSWRLMQQYEPIAEKLRVLDWTDPTPGLPLITSLRQDPEVIFKAVLAATDAMLPVDSKALGLRGITAISKDAYLAVPNPDGPEQSTAEAP